MDKKKQNALRRRAEEKLGHKNVVLADTLNEDLRKVLHELHTYQIELELQNEELRTVQEELVQSRDQFVDLYDFAPIGYLTVSDKNIIMEANLTLAKLLNEERKSLFGQLFSNFIFQEDQDVFYSNIRDFMASPSRHSFNLRMLRRDNGWFWGKLSCVPWPETNKSVGSIRIALHDITDAKRQEDELIKVKKLEATAMLAGGIAHDFNNLLAIIMGNIEMAQQDGALGRPNETKLHNAQQAALRAAELTKKFLTFSAGGEPTQMPISVEEFITDTVSLALGGSNIGFECIFQEDLCTTVTIDASQMALAIGNVINNAMEAMPQGGMIRIVTENADSISGQKPELEKDLAVRYVKISIQDQGPGIPEHTLPQVFDPYFSSKPMGSIKGLGMGLTIAYSILKKHGGAINIASQQDQGTTVTIYLPVSKEPVVLEEILSRQAPPSNKKILVMDDEKMLRELTRHMLERSGYQVEVACDGDEAIQLYKKAEELGLPFGAVILDLTIKGGMGGMETIKQLKEIDPQVRAIVASGYANDPVMSNFKSYGFLKALHKPYQLEELEKTLGSIVS